MIAAMCSSHVQIGVLAVELSLCAPLPWHAGSTDPTATNEEPEGSLPICLGCPAGQEVMENNDDNGKVLNYYCSAVVCPDDYDGGRGFCGPFCVCVRVGGARAV